jgi:osmoprotectant transport system permease protein
VAYGLNPGDIRSLLQAVKYEALAAGDVDVIDGYSTDGRIARYGLRVLQDDRGFFPPYDAAPVVTGQLVRERPEAVAALSELAGLMDEAFVQALNHRTEVAGESVATVAADALALLGLVDLPAGAPGSGRTAQSQSDDSALVPYLWARRAETIRLTLRHLLLVGLSMAAGIVVAVPLGLGLERLRRGAEGVIRGVGLLQTIPSIALLAFMIPVLGIGVAPAVSALFLYSLFPIVRNTYTGVRDASPPWRRSSEPVAWATPLWRVSPSQTPTWSFPVPSPLPCWPSSWTAG